MSIQTPAKGESKRVAAKRRQLKVTAYHEAAHAIMAIERKVKFKEVSIIAEGRRSGGMVFVLPKWTQIDPEDMTEKQLAARDDHRISHSIVFLAGPCATFKMTNRWDVFGGMSDFSNASNYLMCVMGMQDVPIAINEMISEILDWLKGEAVWAMIEAVGTALLEHQTLSEAKVRAICRETA